MIEDGHYAYHMPNEIKETLTKDFLLDFFIELHKIMGVAISDTPEDCLYYIDGTAGWSEAFLTTCRQNNLTNLAQHWLSLPWEEADIFSGMITDMIIENQFCLPDVLENISKYKDIVAQENNIPNPNDIDYCFYCNEFYNKKDIKYFFDEENKEESHCCIDCYEGEYRYMNEMDDVEQQQYLDTLKDRVKTTTPLPKPYHKLINAFTSYKQEDIFKCPQCDKYQLTKVKTNDGICEYCNQCNISANTHANDYYQNQIQANKKYINSLKSQSE